MPLNYIVHRIFFVDVVAVVINIIVVVVKRINCASEEKMRRINSIAKEFK